MNKGNSKEKKDLYNLIVKLPYTEYENSFDESLRTILASKLISKDFRDYLKNKCKDKTLWVKCFMKESFTCGTVTSSRIESKHSIYKRYLDGNKRLSEVYNTFKLLEDQEIKSFKNEIQTFTKKENTEENQYELIKKSKELYSAYIIQKLKLNIIKSLNYSVIHNKRSQIW